jgi:hypothetical protein
MLHQGPEDTMKSEDIRKLWLIRLTSTSGYVVEVEFKILKVSEPVSVSFEDLSALH